MRIPTAGPSRRCSRCGLRPTSPTSNWFDSSPTWTDGKVGRNTRVGPGTWITRNVVGSCAKWRRSLLMPGARGPTLTPFRGGCTAFSGWSGLRLIRSDASSPPWNTTAKGGWRMQHSNSWSEEQVIRVSRMSKHFVRRWQQRVGATPSIEAVNQILASSQRIRRQIRCMVPRFGGWVPHKVLAEYWQSRDAARQCGHYQPPAHHGAGHRICDCRGVSRPTSLHRLLHDW